VLGRLLMELREEVKSRNHVSLLLVEALGIPDFRLYDQPIQAIEAADSTAVPETAPRPALSKPQIEPSSRPTQASLFDQPPVTAKTGTLHDEVQVAPERVGNLKPYAAMKDSGVPWLGDVPEHWEVRTLPQW